MFRQLSFLILICICIGTTSCSKKSSVLSDDATTGTTDGTESTGSTVSIDSAAITSGTAEGPKETGANEDDLIENSTFSSTVSIVFGTTIAISNLLSASGVTITQSGGDVIITSTAKAVDYVLTGTTTDGSVKIYSDNKFKLTF